MSYIYFRKKRVQIVSIGIVKEGFKSVYGSEVQRLARMLSEIDVQSF